MLLPRLKLPSCWQLLMETNLLPTKGFQAENTQKEFREICGRQRHIWLVMKVTNVWGNILHGVNVFDGVGGEGNIQAFLSPLSWAGPGGGRSWAAVRESELPSYF